MDDGPEMIALALCDYCRLAGVRSTHVGPGSPGDLTPAEYAVTWTGNPPTQPS